MVILSSDPRRSHRACEGIRIALGLVSGGHEVTLVFSEQSYLLLSEAGDEMIDGERAVQFLDVLKTFIPLFLIDQEEGDNIDLADFDYECGFVSKAVLASKIGDADCLFRF